MSISPLPSDSASNLPGSGTRLIELVRPYPELYDKSHALYCNNAHKGVLWNQIAKELDAGTGCFPAKKTREQFSYMRKRFKVEYDARKKGIRRPLAPEPDSANYRQPLFVYEQLSFLEPALDIEWEMAEREAREADENGVDDDTDSLRQTPERSGVKTESDCETDSSNPSPLLRKRRAPSPIHVETPTTTTKESSNGPEAKLLSLIRSITSSSSSDDSEPPATIDEEECQIFGKQVAMDLRHLSQRQRVTARYQINKIILTAILKDLETEQINS